MDIRGARILVLEDDALISIDAEDMLLGLGAAAVHLAGTLAVAADLVASGCVGMAMLDLRIGSGRSDGFAEELLSQAIPFIFTSGYGSDLGLPDSLQHVPKVGKPYTPEALLAAFAALDAPRG